MLLVGGFLEYLAVKSEHAETMKNAEPDSARQIIVG